MALRGQQRDGAGAPLLFLHVQRCHVTRPKYGLASPQRVGTRGPLLAFLIF
jgi:hypothetical protein